jgi:hypothetical protein
MTLHPFQNDDISYALEFNPQSYTVHDIKGIVAEVPGSHDEFDWHWILALKDGRFVYASGGCDYTGWD